MVNDKNRMTKEDRKKAILSYLGETDLVLPPKPLHYNMRRQRDAIMSLPTVRRLLTEMLDEGLVEQPEDRPGWYRITDDGEQWLDN